MNHDIALVEAPGDDIRQAIQDPLRAYNRGIVGPDSAIDDLAIVIQDPDSLVVIGGLWGRTGWGWLTIELIFVPEALRGQGIATRLIAAAEAEGLRRGCHSAWLDTLNAKAVVLYQRLGYTRFGELKDFPVGNSLSFLQKRLTPSTDENAPTSD